MLLVLLIVATIILSGMSMLRHYQFQTQAWDMGIFVQFFHNTIRGNIAQTTIAEIPNHLGVHWSPFLLLLAPLYALVPSPYTLLLIQALVLALGAVPLYFLAEDALKNKKHALIISGTYLFYPALHWINWYDFHEIAFSPALFIAAAYFLQKQRWRWAAFFLLLAASVKEDVIMATLALGLWFIVRACREAKSDNNDKNQRAAQTRLAVGCIIAVASAIYFLLVIKVFMPALGGGLLRLDRYAHFGNSAPEIITTMLKNPLLVLSTFFAPQKLIYYFWLFAPVLFLPFFGGTAFILLIPGLLENGLTAFSSQFAGTYQYDAILIPGIFIATVYGLRNIRERWPSIARKTIVLFVAMSAMSFVARSPLSPLSFPTELFKKNNHWETFRQMVREVPPDASVAASTLLVPHIAQREHIYILGQEPFLVDYVLIDGADFFGFPSPEAFQSYADRYALSGNYDIRSINERYFIFIKKKQIQ